MKALVFKHEGVRICSRKLHPILCMRGPINLINQISQFEVSWTPLLIFFPYERGPGGDRRTQVPDVQVPTTIGCAFPRRRICMRGVAIPNLHTFLLSLGTLERRLDRFNPPPRASAAFCASEIRESRHLDLACVVGRLIVGVYSREFWPPF